MQVTVRLHLFELLLEEADAGTGLASVGFELRLARAAQPDAAGGLPGEVGPHPGQARQAIIELGELDLEAALMGLGAAGEDIEDQSGAVDDEHAEFGLEVALLGRRQLGIDEDEIVVQRLAQVANLGQLALADERARHRVRQLLGDGADDRDVDGAGQALQLAERISDGPEIVWLIEIDGQQQGPLDRALRGIGALGRRRGVVIDGFGEGRHGRVRLAAFGGRQGITLGTRRTTSGGRREGWSRHERRVAQPTGRGRPVGRSDHVNDTPAGQPVGWTAARRRRQEQRACRASGPE